MKTAISMLGFFGLIYSLIVGISIIISLRTDKIVHWDYLFFPHYWESMLYATVFVFILGIMIEVAKEQRRLITLYDSTRYIFSKPYNPPEKLPSGVGICVTNHNSGQVGNISARIGSMQESREYVYQTHSNQEHTDLGRRTYGELSTGGSGSINSGEKRIFEIANWDNKGEVQWSVYQGGVGLLPAFDKTKEYIVHVEIHVQQPGVFLYTKYCIYSYMVKWEKNKLIIKEYNGKTYDRADSYEHKENKGRDYEKESEEE